MRYNNYDNSGSSYLTKIVKKTDAEKKPLWNRRIGDGKLNDKRKAYNERGKVYISCPFIEVPFFQIRTIDVEDKFEQAEQLRDITKKILKNKTSPLHGIALSKKNTTDSCDSKRSSSGADVNNCRKYRGPAGGTSQSTSITKRCSKKTTSRPKREKRQTILPNGEVKACSKCKDTWTIQWRSGPEQNRELCSPCGLAYGKRLKKENEKKRRAVDETREQNNS
ncbi:hypothetical protein SMKI_03G0740 [Saccharomyces mikatae IFO 1815]|uniref:GATA-type domain-containing protein n=1 Tax=Saccharomyces mikatae IFO 1815 TaxID=226126 RepID=A0AA35IVB9_SACMI|nr:uncharacterized protein SMKI_03G0740 [Saccharomyces mikatae IFO 1815]CAI4037599.1 hypothetical protein SMKI_03G0740 [Saccharomyces mikatae IFO 1815]